MFSPRWVHTNTLPIPQVRSKKHWESYSISVTPTLPVYRKKGSHFMSAFLIISEKRVSGQGVQTFSFSSLNGNDSADKEPYVLVITTFGVTNQPGIWPCGSRLTVVLLNYFVYWVSGSWPICLAALPRLTLTEDWHCTRVVGDNFNQLFPNRL